jgi:hypothetical protein
MACKLLGAALLICSVAGCDRSPTAGSSGDLSATEATPPDGGTPLPFDGSAPDASTPPSCPWCHSGCCHDDGTCDTNVRLSSCGPVGGRCTDCARLGPSYACLPLDPPRCATPLPIGAACALDGECATGVCVGGACALECVPVGELCGYTTSPCCGTTSCVAHACCVPTYQHTTSPSGCCSNHYQAADLGWTCVP